jgi:hypothetical protein
LVQQGDVLAVACRRGSERHGTVVDRREFSRIRTSTKNRGTALAPGSIIDVLDRPLPDGARAQERGGMVIRHSVIWFTVVSLLLVSLPSGCSFLFVKGPPAHHAQLQSFDCSESNALPVLDVIWAGLNGIGAASAGGVTRTSIPRPRIQERS